MDEQKDGGMARKRDGKRPDLESSSDGDVSGKECERKVEL